MLLMPRRSNPFLAVGGFLTVALLIGTVQILGRAEEEEHWLTLRHKDYLYQVLEFDWPQQAKGSESLSASIIVTQPYEFRHRLGARAQRSGASGTVEIHFPLIDDGRYAPSQPGSSRRLWELGQYRFDLELRDGDSLLGQRSVEVDPNTFIREMNGKRLAQVDSLRQFIECSPERPAYIDHDEIGFTIRTIPERVASCSVEIDVLGPGQDRVAGPLSLNLTPKSQRHAFDGSGWPRGEYWLRARVKSSGKVVGPYLVRQFWKDVSTESRRPRVPLRPGHSAQYLVDDWIFAASEGLRHKPDPLTRFSDGPVVKIDRPWEAGSYIIKIRSLTYDERSGLYRITYLAGVLPEDPVFNRVAGSISRPRYLCLVTSSDGVHWEKPELGRVEFLGSKRNNILRDLQQEDFLRSGEFDSYPYPTKERPIPGRYRFRMYDRSTDGSVNMDNFVLRFFSSRNIEPGIQHAGNFRPQPEEFWGFERRGDLFLALTPTPILHAGSGMSLLRTTERASTHPFEGDPSAFYQSGRSTFTYYDRKSRSFYYYFRPDYPPYPPHGVSYEYFSRSARRTRAVMWTRDGVSWQRRHMLSPDEHDPPGTTFYGFGYLSPAGHTESDTDGQLFLGAVLHYNLVEQKQRQELVWSRDRVHWQRFGANRIPLLANGPPGDHDAGFVSGMSSYYPVSSSKGEKEWWFPYLGGSARYMLAASKDTTRMRRKSLNELGLEYFKKSYPQYELAPFFTSWEDFFEESKASTWVPALARCKAGRLAHVEPVEVRGEFTTYPLLLEGSRLLLNAKTLDGGSVRAELQDAEGNVFPGFGLADSVPFSGDAVGAEFRWRESGLEEALRRVVRIRVVLDKAQLYSFRWLLEILDRVGTAMTTLPGLAADIGRRRRHL